ncbi:MAG: hypothetical protein U0269_19525 [Polyangiales bacterium]
MNLRSLRFLQSLALLTAASSCAAPLNTGDSSSDAKPGEASVADDVAASDALDEAQPLSDGASPVDGSTPLGDSSSADVVWGSCAAEAGAPVDAPAGDGGGVCSSLAGRACAVPGQLACGGPGGAASFGCVCRLDPCPDGSGSYLNWICGGGGALPPPELAAA